MPRTDTATTMRHRQDGRAAKAVRAAHRLESTTFHNPDGRQGGWVSTCTCGASAIGRFRTRDDAISSHAEHLRRYLSGANR